MALCAPDVIDADPGCSPPALCHRGIWQIGLDWQDRRATLSPAAQDRQAQGGARFAGDLVRTAHCCGCRELIKDQLIPRAVAWYTGAAVQDMDDEDEIDDDDEDDDDDDDDDEEDDEEVRCAPDIVPMMLGSAASFGAGVGAKSCAAAP